MIQIIKDLSITQKMVLVILASILFLASTLYIIASNIHPQSYLKIENETLLKDLNRADDAIKDLFPQLTIKLNDWASWDDTYQFVEDLNSEYQESNLEAYSLVNLQINAMIFANTEGEVVFIKVIDNEEGEEIDPSEIKTYFETHRGLTTHMDIESSTSGLLPFSEGPFLFTSLPILKSTGEGPVQGSLTFGTYLDEEVIEAIGTLTHLSLEVFPYGSSESPMDVFNAEQSLNDDADQVIIPLSEETIAVYRVVSDYYGKPLLTLKVESPRDVYLQGKATFSFYMVATSLLLAVFGLILIILLQSFVVSRFTKLEKEVKKVGEHNDLSIRIKEGTRDEIGELASSINNMLDKIVEAERAEDESNEKVRAIGEELKKRLVETEKMNKMMIDRELKMVELKKELSKYKQSGKSESQRTGSDTDQGFY